jgi:hypothetical protein
MASTGETYHGGGLGSKGLGSKGAGSVLPARLLPSLESTEVGIALEVWQALR